jgi:hypothetical protein
LVIHVLRRRIHVDELGEGRLPGGQSRRVAGSTSPVGFINASARLLSWTVREVSSGFAFFSGGALSDAPACAYA